MKQKHYIDIKALRYGNESLRPNNDDLFNVGDIVQITEKFDGANASAAFDVDNDCIVAFSRKMTLSSEKNLNGFWNYINNLSAEVKHYFSIHSSWVVFGEWTGAKNKLMYNDTGKIAHWYIFDIYDKESEAWLPQALVKKFCEDNGLEYIHELYYGEFVSWEHCKQFMNTPNYGDKQEGVVVKNQIKLNVNNLRYPFYLKIVNNDFKETMGQKVKEIDPEKQAAIEVARGVVESVVTKARIEKMIYKLRDEGILPEKIIVKDMKIIAQHLPKRIYEDVVKEEPELVKLGGEYFGKMCNSETMRIAREIIVGE